MNAIRSVCGGMTMAVTGALLAVCSALLLAAPRVASAQDTVNLRQMSHHVIAQWPAARTPQSSKGLSMLLDGMNAVWYDTADGDDYQYIKQSIDPWIAPDGSLQTPATATKSDTAQQDSLGDPILLLYRVTGEKRYYQAASRLRDAMLASGETISRDPESVSRGALPMIQAVSAEGPFLAEYASVFQQQDFERITNQFVAADAHLSGAMNSDVMARYMTALVEALQYYPSNNHGRAVLLKILNRTAAEAVRMQGLYTGRSSLHANEQRDQSKGELSPKLSAPCLFVYALAKGVRLGYLPARYQAFAVRNWQTIESRASAENGAPTSTANMDGGRGEAGARLLAASEMQLAAFATKGAHQMAVVDAWFNSQKRTNAAGEQELFHYKWTDYRSSGFSLFGHMFRSYGVATRRLATAPTVSNLRGAQYYIIASPDNPAKNTQPHYVTAEDAKQVEEWVRRGGVLVLMENDPANADIPHLDILADSFGLHFNNRLTHAATEYDYAMGRIDVAAGGPLFHHVHTLYMKDTCSLELSKGATPLLTYKGDILMATARYGKGTVYAVTDPWLYNEYTDGRKLPPQYDNFAAGMELVQWLLQQHSPAGF